MRAKARSAHEPGQALRKKTLGVRNDTAHDLARGQDIPDESRILAEGQGRLFGVAGTAGGLNGCQSFGLMLP